MQKNFDLSTGQLSEEFRLEFVICSRCKIGRMGCALSGNFNSVFS